jgi:hypothetical protein
MRKSSILLLLILFIGTYLKAQNTDTLTNVTVVKMVKAKLSDDLIIIMIKDSKVNFDVSPDAVKTLSIQNVSPAVIDAMKIADSKNPKPKTTKATTVAPVKSITQATPTPAKKDTVKTIAIVPRKDTVKHQEKKDTVAIKKVTPVMPSPVIVKDTLNQATVNKLHNNSIPDRKVIKDTTTRTSTNTPVPAKQIIKDTIKTNYSDKRQAAIKTNSVISTISYVAPLNRLPLLYDNSFEELVSFIRKWDKRIRDSIQKEQQILKIIDSDEKAVNDKKNANAKGFSSDVLSLKNKLAKDRDAYKRIKSNMIIDGKTLSAQLNEMSSKTDNLIKNRFEAVSKMVAKSEPDPSLDDTNKIADINRQSFTDTVINHIFPATVILSCYENAINPIQDTIAYWNAKALAVIHNDLSIARQLEPLKKQLQQYLTAPKDIQKLNKKEIAALKKQCNDLSDKRKQLAKQMVQDSKNLSGCIDRIREDVRLALKQRFLDAIENIDHSYEDKL